MKVENPISPRVLLYRNCPVKVGFNPTMGEYDVVDLTWDYVSNRTLGYDLSVIKQAKLVVADSQKLADIVQRHTGRRVIMAHYGEFNLTVTDFGNFTVGLLCRTQTDFNNLRANKGLVEKLVKKYNALVYVDREMKELAKEHWPLEESLEVFASRVDVLCLPSPVNSVNDLSSVLGLMSARCGVIASQYSNYAELGTNAGLRLVDHLMASWEEELGKVKSLKSNLDTMKQAARKTAVQINTLNRNKVELAVARIQTN